MTLSPRALPGEAPPAALRRMRLVATGLLVLMAGLFLAARALDHQHPAFGFLRAFSEAAMVGGLADWFAVTALFRHPLGLPIPHTAIVPREKDRIGDTLAQFLRDNFLIASVVARRMRRLDIASAAGRFLESESFGGGRLQRGVSRLAVEWLNAFDPQRFGGMFKAAAGEQLRRTDVAPLLGQALAAAIAEARHVPLIDQLVRWIGTTLAANEHLIREVVHQRAGSILRWTGLDETVSNKLIDGLDRLLAEMADDPQHPLRERVNEALAELAWKLQHDAETQAKVERLKEELIANPAMQRWLDGLWEQARAALLRLVREPERALAGRLGEMLRQLGTTLQEQPALRATINRFLRRSAVGLAADYGDGIVRLVSETVRSWDTGTITRRLENAVGKDLQYIRVNGTLVGGLVGLAIHTVDVLL